MTHTYTGLKKKMDLVFVKDVLIDKGDRIVHAHQSAKVVNKLYEELSDHTLKFQKSDKSYSNLLTCMLSDIVGDGSWTNTTKICIIDLEITGLTINVLADSSDHFLDIINVLC